MKSRVLRILTETTAMMTMLAALAMPVRTAAQEQQQKAKHVQHYIVTDLGTFGGPGTNGAGYQMNNAGWVAGSSNLIPDGPQHAFLWYGAGLLRDLGTLEGSACRDCNSAADGPNARGEAAIGSETSKPDPNGEDFCEYGTHLQCLGAIWKDGNMTPLPTLPGGTPFQVFRFEAVIWSPKGEIRQLRPLPGDTVGFVDVPSLKGIHYAMQSGMYAARTAFAALKTG